MLKSDEARERQGPTGSQVSSVLSSPGPSATTSPSARAIANSALIARTATSMSSTPTDRMSDSLARFCGVRR